MLPEKTTILIVGAGPTGLAAAISLFHHGCKDIVIVDAVERTSNTSRAMAIHAATLEALESIGCADKLVEAGIKGESMNVWNRTASFFTMDLSVLASYTKYPYVLLLPQNKTEEILEEHIKGLGLNVQRPYKAVGIKGDVDELGNTEVTFESGEVIKAQYVIGADGARSVIRQMSGVGFKDPDGLPVNDSLAQIVLADVTFSSDKPPLPKDGVIAAVHGGSFFLVIPLQKWTDSEDSIYRIGFNVPASFGPPPSNPPISYLQKHLDAHAPLALSSDSTVNPSPINIAKAVWSTRFRTHSAIADKFVFRLQDNEHVDKLGGYVFLVGDAAHIHSPAGGQGMNLGIRDAIGLGPALAEHLKTVPGTPEADAHPQPLQVYGEARHKSALAVIQLTKRIMTVVNTLGTNRVVDLQYWLFRLLGTVPTVRRMIAWQVSGLGNR